MALLSARQGVNGKNMVTTKIRHLKNEREAWLRILEHIQQENIYLKNHLSDIIRNDINPDILESLEYFQNQFLNKDTIISFLRYDIVELNKRSEAAPSAEQDLNLISRKQDTFRADMQKMEREFSHLKFQFNDYLAGVL